MRRGVLWGSLPRPNIGSHIQRRENHLCLPTWGFGVCVEWGAACFLDQPLQLTQETLLPSLSLPEEVGDPVQPHSRVQPEATQASSLLYLTGQL